MLTTAALVVEIQNARIAYMQSDEISILLNDWDDHGTQQYFGGVLQKMVSVSAATATAAFLYTYMHSDISSEQEFHGRFSTLPKFDSRVFQLPKEEVNNYFVWRQQDASRNSVQMLGRSYFSHKELHGVNNPGIQDKLMAEHGVNWNRLESWKRRGSCVMPNPNRFSSSSLTVADEDIPLFTADKNYIEQHLVALPEERLV